MKINEVSGVILQLGMRIYERKKTSKFLPSSDEVLRKEILKNFILLCAHRLFIKFLVQGEQMTYQAGQTSPLHSSKKS